MKNNQRTGYVYFISNGKAIKIGYSNSHPEKRLKQLATGSSDTLSLLWYLEGMTMDFEKSLHNFFRNYRVNLEWYDYNIVLNWIKLKKKEIEIQREMGLIK